MHWLTSEHSLRATSERPLGAAGEAETLADPSSLVDEALKYFREARRFRESQKLEAQMRRTDPEQVDALSLLKKLQEQARQPNLRRGLSG